MQVGDTAADVQQMFPHEHGKLICPTTIFGLCRSSLISAERLVFIIYIFRVKVEQTDLGGGGGGGRGDPRFKYLTG